MKEAHLSRMGGCAFLLRSQKNTRSSEKESQYNVEISLIR